MPVPESGYVPLTADAGRLPTWLFRLSKLQGLFATIRISIYASILALVIGAILGVARCSENMTTRLLARTYLELLRNIPPVVIIFIFFF